MEMGRLACPRARCAKPEPKPGAQAPEPKPEPKPEPSSRPSPGPAETGTGEPASALADATWRSAATPSFTCAPYLLPRR